MLFAPKTDLVLTYIPAEVIHSNKYNQNSGIYFAHLFFNTLLHDVVFKTRNNEIYSIKIKNLDVSLYQGQKVTLIVVNNSTIAFIDYTSGRYFYLTNDLKKALGKRRRINSAWLVGIILFIMILLTAFFNNALTRYLFFIPVAYWLYLKISNYLFERKIDKLIVEA